MLLGSASVKAVRRTMMELSPGGHVRLFGHLWSQTSSHRQSDEQQNILFLFSHNQGNFRAELQHEILRLSLLQLIVLLKYFHLFEPINKSTSKL